MRFKKALGLAFAAVSMTAMAAPATARDTIQIAGSSTVLPYASIVAEEFGNAFSFNTPVVGSGGSSGGLRQFCQGVGTNTIDIANASRAIKASEIESCANAGVKEILEVRFGYDGIVFASNASKGDFKLKPEHVYQAIAAQVPQNGKMVANPYSNWSQIDSSLPSQEIVLVIPASNHGTREVFEEKVILDGCEAEEDQCLAFRQDGRVIEISGDYTETLARLEAQADAVGVFGLGFYEQNRDRLKVATINGVTPSLETIGSGEYPVSRPLFFYVKGEHIGTIPGVQEYVQFFLSENMSGFGSQLEEAGLIPLNDKEREQAIKAFKDRKVVSK